MFGEKRNPGFRTSIQEEVARYDSRFIKKELERLRCTLERGPNQFTFYSISKICQHMLEGIYVDQQGVQRVKELCKNRKTRVIFLPTFKSFADPLVLHYMNFFYNLELGFTFGNYEDTPKIHFVEALLKRIGYFLFKRRDFSKNMSTNYINQSLIEDVIETN